MMQHVEYIYMKAYMGLRLWSHPVVDMQPIVLTHHLGR